MQCIQDVDHDGEAETAGQAGPQERREAGQDRREAGRAPGGPGSRRQAPSPSLGPHGLDPGHGPGLGLEHGPPYEPLRAGLRARLREREDHRRRHPQTARLGTQEDVGWVYETWGKLTKRDVGPVDARTVLSKLIAAGATPSDRTG